MSADTALRPGDTVLLVDWPSEDCPRALLDAGFTVVSANLARGTASTYEVAGDALQVRPLDAVPAHVDVVCLFRPEAEHVAIARRAAGLGARLLWVQRGALSDEARAVAAAAGMATVEDRWIAEAVRGR